MTGGKGREGEKSKGKKRKEGRLREKTEGIKKGTGRKEKG